MQKTKVLMFGWEFPPVINGGLGVACLGLCKALASKVDLQMVIPKCEPGFTMEGMQLTGLNEVSIKELKTEIEKKYYKDVNIREIEYVETSLSPYMSNIEKQWVAEVRDYFMENTVSTINEEKEYFEIDELYGGDVIKKVLQFAKIAVRLGLTKDFDVIHAHDWMTYIPAMQLKALTGKPLVLHVHSLEYDRGGEESRNWVYELEKKALETADLVIPVSHYTGTVIHKHYGIDKLKIYPVHNGIDDVHHSEHQKRFPEDLVLFLGRVTMQKGPKFFVETAIKVLKYYPNVRFVLAGTGDLTNELIDLVSSQRIGHKFHFTGFLNKKRVNELLAMSDVYCMPSVSEPFGLSAVEAVQYEIPVVISKQSGAAEVLRGSLISDFWDIDKTANYIIGLLTHENLRKELVKEANIDLKKISWHDAADKVTEAYQLVMDKAPQPPKGEQVDLQTA
ncbi:MAG: glycosyltransferase [Bacteroidia bacterium]